MPVIALGGDHGRAAARSLLQDLAVTASHSLGMLLKPSRLQLVTTRTSDGGHRMQIEISSRHMPLTPALRKHVEDRLEGNLGRFAHEIERVGITLVPGRPGADHECRVTLTSRRPWTLRLRERGPDMYAAITRLSTKLHRVLTGELDRRTDKTDARETVRTRAA